MRVATLVIDDGVLRTSYANTVESNGNEYLAKSMEFVAAELRIEN